MHVKVGRPWLSGNNVLELTLMEHLLRAGTVQSTFIYIGSFNPHNNPMTLRTVSVPFYTRGHRSQKRLINLPKVTQPVRGFKCQASNQICALESALHLYT